MDHLPFDFVSTVCLLLGVSITLYIFPHIQKSKKLPPGPRRLPVIGNAHQLPAKEPWSTFSQWAKTYGNLIHVDLFGQPILVINSRKIASDLMDKRSAIYSDRPIIPIATITTLGDNFVFQPYNNNWRNQRKMIAQNLSVAGAAQYQALQEREWRLQVKSTLQNAETIFSEIKWRAGVIAIRALYGYYIRGRDDPMLTTPLEAMMEFNRLSTPEASLAYQYLPRWMPGIPFFRDAVSYERLHTASATRPYEWCRDNLATGKTLIPNLCCDIWEKMSKELNEVEHDQIYNALAASLGGALDSNASSALTFYMNMILHPEVQRKAQAEIDSVVGSGRLPNISDQASLPYVRAVLTETLRFMPPIVLCVPHALKEDDHYDGYHLPKGAWIIPNLWQMLRDPEFYSDPMTFNPDRYNGDNEAMEQTKSLAFGFGRRVCPGRVFAENSLFALLATTLATCDILPGIDESGKEALPSGKYTSGTISFPEPFKIRIKVRSSVAEALLAEIQDAVD